MTALRAPQTTALAGALPAGGASPARGPAGAARPGRRHLFNRWVDFLALGGGSLLVLVPMAAFYPKDDVARAVLAATMLFLAHFVNHPHFAHSYQLFYEDFTRKAFSPESVLRRRYRFAGIMVPVVLVTFFAAAVAQGSAALLGLAANVMFFTVAWHYAKQGYGILMLDAVHKGARFDAREKRHLLWSTHLAWPTVWLMANDELAGRDYWGLTYYLFDTPDAVLAAMLGLVAVSCAVVGRDFLARWRAGRALPLNGLVAWVTSIYVWMMAMRLDPIVMLVVPFFHSLQYLCVVWRYQLNAEAEKTRRRPACGASHGPAWLRTAAAGVVRFVLVGGLLGAAGFWLAPLFLDAVVGYDRAVFGTTLFIFMAWTFINIHHYFMDAVIWRHENPALRHLFASRREAAPEPSSRGAGAEGSAHRRAAAGRGHHRSTG